MFCSAENQTGALLDVGDRFGLGEGDVKRDTEEMHMEKLSRFHTNMSFLNEIAQLWILYTGY